MTTGPFLATFVLLILNMLFGLLAFLIWYCDLCELPNRDYPQCRAIPLFIFAALGFVILVLGNVPPTRIQPIPFSLYTWTFIAYLGLVILLILWVAAERYSFKHPDWHPRSLSRTRRERGSEVTPEIGHEDMYRSEARRMRRERRKRLRARTASHSASYTKLDEAGRL